jgi:hypothetical protein
LQPATRESGTWTRSRAGLMLFGAAPQFREPDQAELGEVTGRRVSCAKYPRTYPIFEAIGTNDPVAVIDRAETRAIEMLTGVIDELSRTQGEVRAGATLAPPLFSKEFAHAMRTQLRLDVTKKQVWTGKGSGTGRDHCSLVQQCPEDRDRGHLRLPGASVQEEGMGVRAPADTTQDHPPLPLVLDRVTGQPGAHDHPRAGAPLLRAGAYRRRGGQRPCLEQFIADFHGVTILPAFIRACRPPAP